MGALTSSSNQNRHTKGSWYYVWKGEYEIMVENFPEYLPNTYLNYYLQAKGVRGALDPNHTRANEVEDPRKEPVRRHRPLPQRPAGGRSAAADKIGRESCA